MADKSEVKAAVRAAFAGGVHPEDARIVAPTYDAEGVDVAFAGKRDWAALTPAFLNAHSAALSFFSREGLRFFLPAYLLADVDGALRVVDPVFHLTYYFTDAGRREVLKLAKVYRKEGEGHRTWFEHGVERFAEFRAAEAAAIVAYLTWKAEEDEFARPAIEEALVNYWRGRAQGA